MDDIAERVRTAVDALGIPHEIVECDPALADTAEFCAAYGYDLADSANTIVVSGKGDPTAYVACVVLGTTRLDVNSVVRKRLGVRKASFAAAEDVRRITGMEIGGVTPFALDGIPLWIDARVLTRDRIVLGGGSRDRKVVGPPTLLTAIAGAEVVEDLARIAG